MNANTCSNNQESNSLKSVEIFTDGSAQGNPGPGGYGVILSHGKHMKELSEGFKHTTNNRMELLAVIAGLEALKYPCKVKITSDSQYVVKSIDRGTVARWRARGWRRINSKSKVKNIDLWQRYLEAAERHEVEIVWIKGHTGHPKNEICDSLASSAAQSNELSEDTGFIQSIQNEPELF